MKDVEGKVAFITGGDSGIGLGIARACTDAGMKVVITYRSKAHLDDAMKLLANAGDRVHAINLDVTDRPAAGHGRAGRRQAGASGVRNNDLYILTTPEYEAEFRSRGEAIVASLPTDVNPPEARVTMGRMILGKQVYAAERDRRRCERAKTRKA